MEGVAKLFPAAVTAVLLALVLLPMTASAQIHYNNRVKIGTELHNIFGWTATGVYSQIKFAYDDITNSFVLRYTKARNWAWKAGWCFTCYAHILSTTTQMTSHRLYDRALWEMGSWNGDWTGYNEIEIMTTSTPNRIYLDLWIYYYGGPTYHRILLDLIPVILQWIVR